MVVAPEVLQTVIQIVLQNSNTIYMKEFLSFLRILNFNENVVAVSKKNAYNIAIALR